eukprot:TRINITY_DN32576_c0_g1_i1.p1 TRINITY_DN32576_c0_g1~~TRINITY_DN32576_c0_g1_i1.p1  ORF type:complete len:627 (+),score=150.77 TRINITY_DN32576_c0_g1_i1:141-2021(+)
MTSLPHVTPVVVPTKPFAGQKMGTSGCRKKTKEFFQPHYINNFVESVFVTLKEADASPSPPSGHIKVPGSTLIISGDGRFGTIEAFRIIARAAAAHGVSHMILGQRAHLSTPCVSHLIRTTPNCLGAFILTASHNPGGLDEDFGLKFNGSNGSSVLENVSERIYHHTTQLSQYVTMPEEWLAPINEDAAPDTTFTLPPPAAGASNVTVTVVSSTAEYVRLMSTIFDFPAIRGLLSRPSNDFRVVIDSMAGAGGPYAVAAFEAITGAKAIAEGDEGNFHVGPNVVLRRCKPLPDFAGGHPDPNLTYAKALADTMRGSPADPGAFSLGCAFDGDADRNIIFGGRPYRFVTPSDSLAAIALYAEVAIPYYRANGLKGIARSMPTGVACDLVAKAKGLSSYCVPTGWKFFCNLMDSGRVNLCGEESFGTGGDYIREKDGLFAMFCWLAILAHVNSPAGGAPADGTIVTVDDVVRKMWATYGRSLYCRYDFESRPSDVCGRMLDALTEKVRGPTLKGAEVRVGDGPEARTLRVVETDVFRYEDVVDQSVSDNQGWRVHFDDGSRVIVRQSGTGTSGTTVRIYLELLQPAAKADPTAEAADATRPLAEFAIKSMLDMASYLGEGNDTPNVIT